MVKIISRNVFTDGLNLDSRPSLSSDKTWQLARNAVKSSRDYKNFGLTNEGSTINFATIPGNVVGEKYCDERNWTIVFTEDDHLYAVRHADGEVLDIMSASEFGCEFGLKNCDWEGNKVEFKTMQPGNELYVYFSADWTYYRVNIDLMLDPDRKAGLKTELDCGTNCAYSDKCEYFKVIKTGCAPKLTPIVHKNSGGSGGLKAGAYTFVPRYYHIDGGETNWFNFSETVPVGSENNKAGEETASYIDVNFSCLDCKYAKMEVAVIEEVGGIITAKTLNKFNYNNGVYTYRYTGNEGIPIDVSELLVKDHAYLKGKYLEQKDGHMLYYGIKTRRNLNYQPKANQIQTYWFVAEMPYSTVKKHNIKSFMGGESYEFGIVRNGEGGIHSKVFHISPIGGGGSSDSDQTTSTSDLFIEQENSNASLASAMVQSGTTSSTKTTYGDSLVIDCDFKDVYPELDVKFTSTNNTSAYDTLELFLIGDSSKTNLFKCIYDAVNENDEVYIYATGIDGEIANLKVHSITNYNLSSMTIKGQMEGGSYTAFAEQILVAHVESSSGGGSGGSGGSGGGYSTGGGQSQTSQASVSITVPREVKRTRAPKTDSVGAPQNDHYDDIIKNIVDNMNTDAPEHLCEEILLWEEQLKAQCCQCYSSEEGCLDDVESNSPGSSSGTPCANPYFSPGSGGPCDGGSAYERCLADISKPDSAVGDWGSLLDFYNQDNLTPSYSPTNLREGARAIVDSIKERERLERKKRTYTLNKDVSYNSSSSGSDTSSNFSGPFFDCDGKSLAGIDFKIVARGRTKPSYETNNTYPCTVDCNGQPIFGGLAGQPIAHHKFPDTSEEAHFVSKTIGVPFGRYYNDAGSDEDLYIRILGVEFTGIQDVEEGEWDVKTCEENPYTIVQAERTESNSLIKYKGVATGTFKITNNGKEYEQQRYGLNSMEEVSYYHDDGEGGRLSNAGSGESHAIYSLDAMSIGVNLSATKIKEELRFRGQGERYHLYAKGKEPEDSLRGTRRDALGAVSAVNLSRWETGSGEYDINFQELAKADDVASPSGSGTTPLMNRSQQECIWVGSGLPQLTDESFTGDVLEYNVPISDAQASYVSAFEELENQYGPLENLNYVPIMQAGRVHSGGIKGLCGDTYRGVFSFVKTGFVSDKVGSCTEDGKFDIPAQVPTKNEKRCICDGPEDPVHQNSGAWVWTELPEEGDAADPKNWAGTHTHDLSHTDTYEEAVGTQAVSDFYFPGTTTMLVIAVVESKACPWLREKSDEIAKQWFPEIKHQFRYDSGNSIDNSALGWEDCFLPQYHREIEQPSLWKKLLKTIIRTALTIITPMLGLGSLVDISNGGIDFVGNVWDAPMLMALWWLMVQVLFSNDNIDKLLGIPVCKDDEAGGMGVFMNRGFFTNPTGYNLDYSSNFNYYTYEGIPEIYNVCDYEDEITGEIFISDRQLAGSIFDAYTHVRPFSKIDISANYGEITNLTTVNGTLYAHTTDALMAVRHNRAIVQSDLGSIVLGSAGFLSEPEGMTEGIIEGYAGLKRHNSQINTQYGYFWVDEEADRIYRLSNQGLEAISDAGMFNFFKEQLLFCNIDDCVDQRGEGTAYYALGVDPRLNRFLITKSDGDSSFTLSYDLDEKIWISFHDYVPRDYIWDRRDLFSLKGNTLWKHNDDCNYQTYYGTYYPFVLEFTAISKTLHPFSYESTMVNTEAEKCSGMTWITGLDITFNKLSVRNNNQGTPTLNLYWVGNNDGDWESAYKLVKENGGAIKIHNNNDIWSLNDLHDYASGSCSDQPLLLQSGCEPYPEINESAFDCTSLNKKNYRGKVLDGKYLIYRFTFDHDPQIKVNAIYVETYGEED